MSGAGNRRKGHQAERDVVSYLRAHGWDDATTTRNTGGAGGRQVGDISFEPGVCLEVKSVAGSAWPTWLRQAEAEAGPDRIAAVVRRTTGDPNVGRWVTVARYDDGLYLGLPVPIYVRSYGWLKRCRYSTELDRIEGAMPDMHAVIHHRDQPDSLGYLACRFSTFVEALRDQEQAA